VVSLVNFFFILVAIDLIEKARKIKSEINTFKGQLVKEQYSASDSEAIAASKAALIDTSASSFNQIRRPTTQQEKLLNYRQDSKGERENFNIEENDEKLISVEEKAHIDESYESMHHDHNARQHKQERQKEPTRIEIKRDSNARNSTNRRLSSNEGYRDRESITQPIGRSSTTTYNSEFNMIPVKSDKKSIQSNWTDDESLYNSTLKGQHHQQQQKKQQSPLKEHAFNSIESMNTNEQQTGSLTTILDEAKKLPQTASTPHLFNKDNAKKVTSMPAHDEATTQQQHGSSYSKLSSSQYLESDSEELFLKSPNKQLIMSQIGTGKSTQSISSTGNRPEKLFSNRNLNQKLLANMQMNSIKSASSVTNINPPVYGSSNVQAHGTQQTNPTTAGGVASKTTAAISNYTEAATANGNEMDSDGSEHSLISNRSKKSSIGAISQPGYNELIKGANTTANTKISGLAASLDQYGTPSAANKTTSKQQLNSASQSLTTSLPSVNPNSQMNISNSVTGGAYGGSKMITDPIQNFFPSKNQANNINNLNSIKPVSQDTSVNAKNKSNLQTNNSGQFNLNEKNDGTLSDSALSNPMTSMISENANKKRRPSMAKALVILGLSKKSNSASNLAYGKINSF
jgi:hypothetical protein